MGSLSQLVANSRFELVSLRISSLSADGPRATEFRARAISVARRAVFMMLIAADPPDPPQTARLFQIIAEMGGAHGETNRNRLEQFIARSSGDKRGEPGCTQAASNLSIDAGEGVA